MWRRLLQLPNALLILALVTQILTYPVLGERAGRALPVVFEWLILSLALRAARSTLAARWVGFLLLVAAMGLHAGALRSDLPQLLAASLLMQAVFHAFVVVWLLRYVLSDEVMTLDELFAAASMYVLMAFTFAYLYALVELTAPGAFFINQANNPDARVSWWELLYFSSTCLTSVGFGDITPVSDVARALVILQQMMGVLYVALLISRLIQMQGLSPRRDGGGG